MQVEYKNKVYQEWAKSQRGKSFVGLPGNPSHECKDVDNFVPDSVKPSKEVVEILDEIISSLEKK